MNFLLLFDIYKTHTHTHTFWRYITTRKEAATMARLEAICWLIKIIRLVYCFKKQTLTYYINSTFTWRYPYISHPYTVWWWFIIDFISMSRGNRINVTDRNSVNEGCTAAPSLHWVATKSINMMRDIYYSKRLFLILLLFNGL